MACLAVLLLLTVACASVADATQTRPPGWIPKWKKKPPTASRGDTCPGYCTCKCKSPPPFPPSPRPPRPPRPSPPRPSPPSPSPPPPPKPAPPTCNYNKLRPNVVPCSQNASLVPFKLHPWMDCAPVRDLNNNAQRMGCTVTVQSSFCGSGCDPNAGVRSLYFLADEDCHGQINQAIVTYPGSPVVKKQVFAHYNSTSCLIKYSLTTEPAGLPIGSTITVLLPTSGACSNIINLCRPGDYADVSYCFFALASYSYDQCPFQQIRKNMP